jgi:hypothetical protein
LPPAHATDVHDNWKDHPKGGERHRRKANGGRISRKHNLSKTDDNHKIGKDTVEERGREKNKNDQNHKSDRVET